MSSNISRVTVLGTGVLGAQIAFQSAFRGFTVTAYDINEAATDAAEERFDKLAHTYLAEVEGATGARLDETLARLTTTTDLAVAADADLIIEAVPEILELKREIFGKLNEFAPAHTIFATNSSTLMPSAISDASGRPDRFIALHFANNIWRLNIAEVMGTAATDPAVYQRVVAFATEIGMVPIQIHKEQPGYVLNSLLVPFLHAGADLLVKGVATPETIDKTWRIGTGAPMGPFQIYDIVGLNTAYNVSMMGGESGQAFGAYLKEHFLDKGKLGVATGEGFYTYPTA